MLWSSTRGDGSSSGVDTRLLCKPAEFEGKQEDWPRFQLKTKAYLGAIDVRSDGQDAML